MSQPADKPHLGRLEQWEKHYRGTCPYFYTGIFVGHPQYHGTMGYTSLVVKEDGNEIETLNSRYTLGEAKKVLTMEELEELAKALDILAPHIV